ncbi:MAG: glucose-6-phosphate dehydrogenase assembly protein OpcA [Actinomycetota bacterium]|nr:glucose-6-phosphate dehydrogenase assembly protein OpcA [Actinomycetota bacterium]
MTTLWDTTGTEVVKALSKARNSGGSMTSGLALTFVVAADEKDVAAAEQAASSAAAMHPCRLVVVVRREPLATTPRLDAEVTIGGRLGPGEAIELRMYGRLSLHAESVVLPLLASDAPVVTWWQGVAPEQLGTDGLGVFADRRVTDAGAAPDPITALQQRARDYAPGDTDLAWTRITRWRSILATAVDAAGGAGRDVTVVGAEVYGADHSPSAALLAGWLSSRLGAEVSITSPGSGSVPDGMGVAGVRLDLAQLPAIRVDHRDGTGVVSQEGRPDSSATLVARETGELLGEELRRLDVDDLYSAALAAATHSPELGGRSPTRSLIWRDPADATVEAKRADSDSTVRTGEHAS